MMTWRYTGYTGSVNYLRTFWEIFHNLSRALSGLSQNFLWTFSDFSLDFLRIFQNIQSLALIAFALFALKVGLSWIVWYKCIKCWDFLYVFIEYCIQSYTNNFAMVPLYRTIKTIQILLHKFDTNIFCLPSTTQSSSVGRWPNNPRWGCCCYYFSISASAVAVRSLILLLLLLLSQSLHFDTHINILLWTPR